MFTGLVRELGQVEAVEALADESARLTIRTSLNPAVGDSICVNGVCLTVAAVADETMSAVAMKETLARSTTGRLRTGDQVNLEPALTLQTPLGGHIVQGHVDATAVVVDRSISEHWEVVTFGVGQAVARYLVEKGSVAVDGVSLTVAAVRDRADGGCEFDVYLIPVTLATTTLGRRAVGSDVNIEVDVLAKYVERLSAQ
ncbi:MAG: riboflavin synthase [Actinobacteria bacterium]|nr:riboflavin synthase [Actinomycetota bacterium]